MSKRPPHAFTLIELIIVLVIIAVASGIVVPSYGRFRDRALFNAFTMEVRDLVAYAREQAIENDTTARLSLDTRARVLRVVVAPSRPSEPEGSPSLGLDTGRNSGPPPAQPEPRLLPIPEDILINDGGQSSLLFRSDGTCDGAKINVRENGYEANIEILASAGRAVIQSDTETQETP